ncbi:cystathionine beta-lyase [Neotabrizicola sp. VNH66]|uniref:cystathionine beta-lyase n=1 Tax=Neotabrizicola sp. VNH66 TaxID=3400918 RepID=UPI003C05507E
MTLDPSQTAVDTVLIHSGRAGETGPVNVPVHRASTILFETVADLDAAKGKRFAKGTVFYGRFGTPDTFAFEDSVSALEGAVATVATPSGLAACVLPLVAFLKPGDHVLVADTVYEPTRTSLNAFIRRNGVEVEYVDPRADLAPLIRDTTRMIYLESPGSLTFEVQDLPAIAALARGRGIITVCDNTWATGYFCRPLELGIDIVVQAATKYIVGHSDAMLGTVSVADAALHQPLREAANWMGYAVSPDAVYLGARGLRTLAARLKQHHATGLDLARWLEGQAGIARVLHPGLPSHPDHAIFARDFRGASGLFSVLLDTTDRAVAVRFADSLRLFGLGFSWGGFESLVLPGDPAHARTATRWDEPRQLVRLHAGLEDPEDLRADLAQALTQAFGA